jgi:gamma-glutamyltranspeptidase
MAGVLEELGRGGKAAFYEGRIAQSIVAAVQASRKSTVLLRNNVDNLNFS